MKDKLPLSIVRMLRRNQTEAENKLWYYLRDRRLNGIKFRRQQRIGKYVVDFVTYEHKLVIEVDGGQHNEVPGINSDTERTAWLVEHGLRVIRFWNNDVLKDTDLVLTSILNELSGDVPSS